MMLRTNVQIRPFHLNDAVQVFQAIHESLAEVSRWLPELNTSLTLET